MENSEKQNEFTRNVYGPYDAAVQTELDKHSSVLASLRSRRFVNYTQGFLLLCGSCALLAVVLVLSYKYFYANPYEKLQVTNVAVQTDLNDLTEGQEEDVLSDILIQTRYTVFHDAITDTGAHVITGLEYSPLDTRTPVRQYCYLQLGKSAQEMISKIEDGIVVTITQRAELKGYSDIYCNYVAS